MVGFVIFACVLEVSVVDLIDDLSSEVDQFPIIDIRTVRIVCVLGLDDTGGHKVVSKVLPVSRSYSEDRIVVSRVLVLLQDDGQEPSFREEPHYEPSLSLVPLVSSRMISISRR